MNDRKIKVTFSDKVKRPEWNLIAAAVADQMRKEVNEHDKRKKIS